MAFGDSFSLPLIGTSVKNARGEEIGILSDIVFDAGSGRLRFLVVELRSDGSQVIVPWEQFGFHPGAPVVLPVTAAELDAIPRLGGHVAQAGIDPTWRRDPVELDVAADTSPPPEAPEVFRARPRAGAAEPTPRAHGRGSQRSLVLATA